MPQFKQWETVFSAKSYSAFMPGLSQYFPQLRSNDAPLNHEGVNNSWSISSSPARFWPVKSTASCYKKKQRKLQEGDERTGNKRLNKMDAEILNSSCRKQLYYTKQLSVYNLPFNFPLEFSSNFLQSSKRLHELKMLRHLLLWQIMWEVNSVTTYFVKVFASVPSKPGVQPNHYSESDILKREIKTQY